MKTKKLHIKIFLVSILILALTEVIIFFLFRATAVDYLYKTTFDYLSFRSKGFKTLIEEKLGEKELSADNENRNIEILFKDIHRLYNAQVCLLSPEAVPVTCAGGRFVEIIPRDKMTRHKEFLYLTDHKKDKNFFYMRVPVMFPDNEEGSVVVVFDKRKIRLLSAAEDMIFFFLCFCLIGIGFGVAVLLFPASSYITEPLRGLRSSAMRIADGDFSHRTIIKTDDEIGDLGNAFNQMAGRIEQMIKSTKELTANISHELRSPLARIRIAGEIIHDKLENRKNNIDLPEEELEAIRMEVEEMDLLIGQILVMSKLDIQKNPQHMEVLDMTKLVRDMSARFIAPSQKKSVDIHTGCLQDSITFLGSPEDIRTVCSNLFDNAVKYSSDNGKIEVGLLRNAEYIELSVFNTCDLDNDLDLVRIFEPFYRPVSNIEAGVGLGLAITKKIIENYGGSIEVIEEKKGLMVKIGLKDF